jgi:hypothetical protein
LAIASASKWLYGAYVAERRQGTLTAEDVQFLNFTSGYTRFAAIGDCFPGDTVGECAARGDNDIAVPAHVGKFHYNGGHMQQHASLPAGMNLGAMDSAALAAELRRLLGSDIKLSFGQPQLAGGVRTTAADYARFLRKVLGNELQIAALLGSHKVCTNPATCAGAISTPITSGLDWHYSIGHWVEDDARAQRRGLQQCRGLRFLSLGWMPARTGTASWRGPARPAVATSPPIAVGSSARPG